MAPSVGTQASTPFIFISIILFGSRFQDGSFGVYSFVGVRGHALKGWRIEICPGGHGDVRG
jgi:hypothetical protein